MSATTDLGRVIAILAELLASPPPPECWNCTSQDIHAKSLCRDCYDRWDYAGRGDTVPDRRRRPKRTGCGLEDFLAARQLGATVQQAARHAGIPEHTGWRYDAQIRAAAGSGELARSA